MEIGNCIDSFDEDGNCINDFLPWCDVTEFAQSIDQHGDNFTLYNILVEYDNNKDVHTFKLLK